MSVDVQEIVALTIVGGAAFYLVRTLTGWPRRKARKTSTPVVVGDRLARGLKNVDPDRDEDRQ